MADGMRVEIAFDGSALSDPASWTWTDVSDYVEFQRFVTVTRGRADELSVASPSVLQLVVDNKDGRFTPGNPSSPYYPDVDLGKPVRVLVEHQSVTYPRFVGWVNEWPTSWPTSGATSFANLTATGILGVIGQADSLTSTIGETILAQGVDHYWPCDDPSGSFMASDLGTLPLPLGPMMTEWGTRLVVPKFGSEGVTGSSQTALTLGLSIDPIMLVFNMTADFALGTGFTADEEGISLSAFVKLGDDAFGGDVLRVYWPSASVTGELRAIAVWLFNDEAGALIMTGAGADAYLTGPGNYSNRWVHVGVRYNYAANTFALYVDGQIVDSAGAIPKMKLLPGGSVSLGSGGDVLGGGYPTYAHAVVTAGWHDIPAIYAAQKGWVGDLTGDRVDRYASWVGLRDDWLDTSSGEVPMGHVDTYGRGPLDVMRVAEQTEAGVLGERRDGRLFLTPRSQRYDDTVALTLDAANEEVQAPLDILFDRFGLANLATVTNASGQRTRIADEASIEAYGVAPWTAESAARDGDDALSQANWRVAARSQPRERVARLSVTKRSLSAAKYADLLALEVGDRIEVINLPAQAGAATRTFVVEGWAESATPGEHLFTFNVSDPSEYGEVWTLEDPTYGAYDANPIAL